MTEEPVVPAEPDEGTTRSPLKFPWLLIVFLLLIAGVLSYINFFAQNIADGLAHQDYGVVTILNYGCGLLATAAILAWLFFFSGLSFWVSKLVPVVAILAGVTWLVLFYPVFEGNIGIRRWELRFFQNEREIADVSNPADLSIGNDLCFPQFLGPWRNGIVIGNIGTGQPEIVWKQPVGWAYSGFAGNTVFVVTMEQSGEDELITCRRVADGTLVWSHRYPARYQDPTSMGGIGPRGTPAINAGKVYAHGGTGILTCLNASTGERIWQVDIPQQLGISRHQHTTISGLKYTVEDSRLSWGRAASPLIYKNLVILPAGGPHDGPFVSLIAFDKNTGQEIWRGGSRMISYGSAGLAKIDGQDAITIVNEASIAGHDPRSGRELWHYDRDGQSNAGANCSQVVEVAENVILHGKGYGLGGELLKINQGQPQSIWQNSRVVKTKFTVPVVYQNHIYCISDGVLECTDLKTGKRVWKKNRVGQGQLLLVINRDPQNPRQLGQAFLLVHSERGKLYLIRATPDNYQEIDSFTIETIDGVCWNMLCLVDGNKLLVRSEKEAALIRLPPQQVDSVSTSGADPAEVPGSADTMSRQHP